MIKVGQEITTPVKNLDLVLNIRFFCEEKADAKIVADELAKLDIERPLAVYFPIMIGMCKKHNINCEIKYTSEKFNMYKYFYNLDIWIYKTLYNKIGEEAYKQALKI